VTLGSLFDGIGGWQLAAIHNGVKPIWSSEIEPFPCAVTKKHFPDTLQLGDITKLNGAELPPVDIICAGSPCQDLSVAGKQEGLKGARSGLFMDAIKLVRDMRRASGGKSPRYFVWENVPGAFSSNKGMDFRAVLEEIAEAEIPMPDNNKWADAGVVEWDGGSLAWRVLDAQYWGVPQRRRRIFLVADFGGQSAGEILFEREGSNRHFTESGEAGKGTAARTESGVGSASVVRMRAGCAGGGKGALVSRERSLTLAANTNDQVLFVPDKARALTARNDGSPCVDRGPEVIAAGFKHKASPSAGNIGYKKECAPTLMEGQESAVAVYDMTHADEVMRKVPNGRAPTLNARMGTGGNQVPVLAFDTTQVTSPGNFSHPKPGDPCHPLCAGAHVPAVAYSIQGNTIDRHAVMAYKSVRRLTPTECERLQGLSDGYTLIDDKTCSDTARYKALGNGMAQPCADYVIRRIKEART